MSSEHTVQNAVRNRLSDHGHFFRVNVGTGWAGKASRLPNGTMLITDPRPLSSGLPPGFSDLVGWVPVTITEEHVGQTLAIFAAVECKAVGGRVTPQQANFISAVRRSGGLAGIAHSPEEAVAIVRGHDTTTSTSTMKPEVFCTLCDQLGWSVDETIRQLGVSRRTVTNWRQGHTPIPRAVERLLPKLLEEQTAARRT